MPFLRIAYAVKIIFRKIQKLLNFEQNKNTLIYYLFILLRSNMKISYSLWITSQRLWFGTYIMKIQILNWYMSHHTKNYILRLPSILNSIHSVSK